MSSLGLHLLLPLMITDVILGALLLWMWTSGWARDDQRCYRKMRRTYKRKGL